VPPEQVPDELRLEQGPVLISTGRLLRRASLTLAIVNSLDLSFAYRGYLVRCFLYSTSTSFHCHSSFRLAFSFVVLRTMWDIQLYFQVQYIQHQQPCHNIPVALTQCKGEMEFTYSIQHYALHTLIHVILSLSRRFPVVATCLEPCLFKPLPNVRIRHLGMLNLLALRPKPVLVAPSILPEVIFDEFGCLLNQSNVIRPTLVFQNIGDNLVPPCALIKANLVVAVGFGEVVSDMDDICQVHADERNARTFRILHQCAVGRKAALGVVVSQERVENGSPTDMYPSEV
jgi:hypothetical protein